MHLQRSEESGPVLSLSAYSLEIVCLTEPGAHWCIDCWPARELPDPPFLEWLPYDVPGVVVTTCMLVYFPWFLGKLRKAVNLRNKMELDAEDQVDALLSMCGPSACRCISQAGKEPSRLGAVRAKHGAPQLPQERWAPASFFPTQAQDREVTMVCGLN